MLVLIVDDEPEACGAMAALLEQLDDVAVVAVNDPGLARTWLSNHQPDLVLVDYQMPGMSGIDLIRWVRERDRDYDIPMLMLAGQDDGDLLSDAVEAGASDFLRRPVQASELVARTRSMLKLRAKTRELLNMLARLQELATIDSLTGAFNRRYLLERLDEEIKRSFRHRHSLSIILFDIDHFKSVNDTHGHAGGDRVLETLAAAAQGALRASDVLGRIGGEEFVIILPHTGIDGALLLAERLRQRLADIATDFAGRRIHVTVSAGVAQVRVGESVRELLARADGALYAAKHAGRNRVARSAGAELEALCG